MDNEDKAQDENNISPILTLPEEAMRKIFNYLSFETLYFSLRTVCKNIHTYVNDYLNVRGTSFFVSCQKGLKKEVIEITEMSKKGFILLRTPASTIPWVTSKLQNNEILDEDRDKDRLRNIVLMLRHAEKYQTGVCHIYNNEKSLTFPYDLESEMWEKLLQKCTPLKCLEHKGTSRKFIQMLESEIIPYHSETHNHNHTLGYGYYPFLQIKAKDKSWSAGKIMYCKRLR